MTFELRILFTFLVGVKTKEYAAQVTTHLSAQAKILHVSLYRKSLPTADLYMQRVWHSALICKIFERGGEYLKGLSYPWMKHCTKCLIDVVLFNSL